MTKTLLSCFVIGMTLNAQSFAQSPANSKEVLVKELLKLQGETSLNQEAIQAIIADHKEVYKNVPAEKWKLFETKLKEMDKTLRAKTEKLYMETYSEAVLKDMVAFFKSPSGAEFLRSSPEIMMKVTGVISDVQAELDKLVAENLESTTKK